MNEIFLTPSATARLIGRSEGSVRAYAAAGKLPCIVTTTGRRVFRKSEVERFKALLPKQTEGANQ
jgi:predicted site-specific integrase-resolvase